MKEFSNYTQVPKFPPLIRKYTPVIFMSLTQDLAGKSEMAFFGSGHPIADIGIFVTSILCPNCHKYLINKHIHINHIVMHQNCHSKMEMRLTCPLKMESSEYTLS